MAKLKKALPWVVIAFFLIYFIPTYPQKSASIAHMAWHVIVAVAKGFWDFLSYLF